MAKKQPAITLEDRVRRLEAFRYTMLGQVNATRTVLFAAWNAILSGRADVYAADPVASVRAMRDAWLNSPEMRKFPGVNPAHLDSISQEYEKAIDELTAELLQIAEGLERMRRQSAGK